MHDIASYSCVCRKSARSPSRCQSVRCHAIKDGNRNFRHQPEARGDHQLLWIEAVAKRCREHAVGIAASIAIMGIAATGQLHSDVSEIHLLKPTVDLR